MHTVIRHEKAPNPSGCRWCGVDERPHASRWTRSVGLHRWTPPTRNQRLARMLSRRRAA
jgi:hypothetical protein